MSSKASASIESLIEAHQAAIEGYVRRRVPEPEASDLLQQIWLRAIQYSEQLSSPESARAWLYSIARNAMTDASRAKSRMQRAHAEVAQGHASASPAVAPDRCDCSLHQMNKLAPSERAILERLTLHRETVVEAACALGITPGAANVRLHRARARMRELLKGHCGVESTRDCISCGCLEAGCCPPPNRPSAAES